MNNESCVSAPVYVMLSGGHLMQVAAEPIAGKVNIPFSVLFESNAESQLTGVAKEQKRYLNAAAEAAFYSALNVHDRGLQSYRYSVGLHKAFGGGGLTLSAGSSSAGLGYALTLALANRQQCQKTGLRNYQAIYATGELGVKRGLVQKISYLVDKIQTAVAHAQSNAIESFVIFYPADNAADVQSLSAEFLAQLQASGGRLVAVQWVRDALVYLYDEFDGPAVTDWWTENPFLGLQSFEISDNWRLFGVRKKLRDLYKKYLNAEAQHQLLVVTGLSGSGKSSLVKAGLLPNLRGKKGAAIRSISANDYASFKTLQEAVAQWAAAIEPADSTRSHVLLIDQFESCVTLLGASTEEWLMWTQQLNAMCQEQPSIRLIVTVRSDFLEFINSVRCQLEVVDQNLSEVQLSEVIEKSMWSAEIELSDELKNRLLADCKTVNYVLPMLSSCFRRLHDHGLKQWKDEAVSDPQAWARQTPMLHVSDYVAIGGMSGVLTQTLDKILQKEDYRTLTAPFFELFVGVRDGCVFARSVSADELTQHEFLPQLVATLYQEQLLLRSHSAGVSADVDSVRLSATASNAYRLAHDCLLSSWPLLQSWVKKQTAKSFFKWQNQIQHRYQAWIAAVKINATERNAKERAAHTHLLLDGNELSEGVALELTSPWMKEYLSASSARQTQQTKKANRRTLMLAVLAVAALVGGAGAYWQKRVADGERIRAETQQKKAEMQQKKAEKLLGQTRQSLEFMDRVLRPQLDQYVKIEIKENIIGQMEEMLRTLKQYQSEEQLYLNKISLLQNKAKVILQNKNNEAAVQKALNLQLEAEEIAKQYEATEQLVIILVDLSDTSLLLGQTSKAEDYLLQSKKIIDNIVDVNLKNKKWQTYLSLVLSRLGEMSIRKNAVQQAQAFYQKAYDIDKSILDLTPNDVLAQYDLSVSLEKLGDVSSELGNKELSLKYYLTSEKILESIVNHDSKNITAKFHLSVALINIAQRLFALNEPQQAKVYFLKSKQLISEINESDPENLDFLDSKARYLNGLGDVAFKLKEFREGLSFYRECMEIRQYIADKDPQNLQLQARLITSIERLGVVSNLLNENGFPSSQHYFEKMLMLAERNVNADPHNAEFKITQLISYLHIGDVNLQHNEKEEAIKFYEKAKTVAESMNYSKAKKGQYTALLKLADVFSRQNQDLHAKEYMQNARNIAEQIRRENPTDPETNMDLLKILVNLGDNAIKLNQNQQALVFFKEGRDIFAQLSEEINDDPELDELSFEIYEKLGDSSVKIKKFSDAINYYNQGFLIVNNVHSNVDVVNYPFLFLIKIGDTYLKRNKMQEAINFYEKGRIVSESMSSALGERDLAAVLNRIGYVFYRQTQYLQAQMYYKKAKDIALQVLKKYPGDLQTKIELSNIKEHLGDSSFKLNQLSQSIGFYKQGYNTLTQLADDNISNLDVDVIAIRILLSLGDVSIRRNELSQSIYYYKQGRAAAIKFAINYNLDDEQKDFVNYYIRSFNEKIMDLTKNGVGIIAPNK